MMDQAKSLLTKSSDELVKILQEKDSQLFQLQARVHELELKVRPPNWPQCFPVCYHNIDEEIPPRRKKFVRFMYRSYYLLWIVLIYNCVAALAIQLSQPAKGKTPNKKEYSSHFYASLVHLLGIAFAFPLWYWPSYRAIAIASRPKYFWSFVGLFFGLVYSGFMTLGIARYGGCGIFYVEKVMEDMETTAVYLAYVGLAFWGLQVAFFCFCLLWMVRYYNKDGFLFKARHATEKTYLRKKSQKEKERRLQEGDGERGRGRGRGRGGPPAPGTQSAGESDSEQDPFKNDRDQHESV